MNESEVMGLGWYLWREWWNWWTRCWRATRRTVCGRWRRSGCVAGSVRCSFAIRTWWLDVRACRSRGPTATRSMRWARTASAMAPAASAFVPAASCSHPTRFLYVINPRKQFYSLLINTLNSNSSASLMELFFAFLSSCVKSSGREKTAFEIAVCCVVVSAFF